MKATLNYNQSLIFNAIFNDDMTMKKDCPKRIAYFGGYRSGKRDYWASISLALKDNFKQVKK